MFERLIVSAPGIGKCKICAVRHRKDQPHDVRSVYYIVRFRQRYGREPDIFDAMEESGYVDRHERTKANAG